MTCVSNYLCRTSPLYFLRKSVARSPALYIKSFQLARISLRSYSTTVFSSNDVKFEDAGSSHSSSSFSDAEMRSQVLEASLAYVSKYGWSREAIEAACKVEGLPPGMHAFAAPLGGIDIVLHFYATRNQQLAEAMQQWRTEKQSSNVDVSESGTMKHILTSADKDNFIYRALEYRLKAIVPVLDVWPQALGILALPTNIPSSLGMLAQLVDEIWAQAGDRSTDMTWYAKRLGLAYVYNLTEVYMIQDKSPDLGDTWIFLRSRIDDLRSIKQMNPSAVGSLLKNSVSTFGNVTCNVLGFSRRC